MFYKTGGKIKDLKIQDYIDIKADTNNIRKKK